MGSHFTDRDAGTGIRDVWKTLFGTIEGGKAVLSWRTMNH